MIKQGSIKRIRVKDQEFNLPKFSNLVHSFKWESLFAFGGYEKYPNCKQVFGFGWVEKIEKGDKFDIVKINFGRTSPRTIVVISNRARRQIYTLKRGQYCIYLGHYRVLKSKYREGEYDYLFYANALQGLYVPKAVDIRNYDGEDEELMEKEESLLDFLDQFGESEDL